MAIPQLPANSIVQVLFEWEYQSSKLLNVLHYRSTNSTPLDNYASICNALGDTFNAANGFMEKINNLQSDAITLTDCKVQPVYPVRLAPVSAFFGNEGLRDEQGIPSNVALVATKGSYVATRRGKGSFHLAGMSVENLDAEGNWSQDLRTAARLAFDILETTISLTNPTVDFVPILWSPDTPTTSIDIVDFTVQPMPRVMRRRTKGVGQ